MNIINDVSQEESEKISISKITKEMYQYRYYEWEERKHIDYQYDNVLKFPADFSFGIEIEFQAHDLEEKDILYELNKLGLCINNEVIRDRKGTRDYTRWRLMKESTCDWEIISPVLHDTSESWKEIEQVCNLIRENFEGFIDEHCSLHIHVGRNGIFDDERKLLELKEVYRFLETFTYAFSAGDNKKVSEYRTFEYAVTLAGADKYLWWKGSSIEDYETTILETEDRRHAKDLIDSYYATRTVGLNFRTKCSDYSTIEFRTFNGSLNQVMIQTYVMYVANIIRIIYNRKVIPEYADCTCYMKSDKILVSKRYLDICLELLTDDIEVRQQLVDIIVRNGYELSRNVVRALKGNYTQAESKKFDI